MASPSVGEEYYYLCSKEETVIWVVQEVQSELVLGMLRNSKITPEVFEVQKNIYYRSTESGFWETQIVL